MPTQELIDLLATMSPAEQRKYLKNHKAISQQATPTLPPTAAVSDAPPLQTFEDLPPGLTERECHFARDLTPNAIKAEARALHEPEELLFRARCYRCNAEMWTWSENENVCERCGYELRIERATIEKRIAKEKAPITFGANETGRVPVNVDGGQAQKQINPYAPTSESRRQINPMGATSGKKTSNPF